MDERPHDQGPGDTPAREGVPEGDGAADPARAAGLTKDAKALAPPASAVPYALWPRAAGGGAGAVSVPVALDAEEDMGCRVADAAPMAPDQLAEAVIDAPEPPQISPQAQLAEAADEPAPSVGGDGVGTLVLPAAPALEAEPITRPHSHRWSPQTTASHKPQSHRRSPQTTSPHNPKRTPSSRLPRQRRAHLPIWRHRRFRYLAIRNRSRPLIFPRSSDRNRRHGLSRNTPRSPQMSTRPRR